MKSCPNVTETLQNLARNSYMDPISLGHVSEIYKKERKEQRSGESMEVLWVLLNQPAWELGMNLEPQQAISYW